MDLPYDAGDARHLPPDPRRRPGAALPSAPPDWSARLPISMVGLGIVLLVEDAHRLLRPGRRGVGGLRAGQRGLRDRSRAAASTASVRRGCCRSRSRCSGVALAALMLVGRAGLARSCRPTCFAALAGASLPQVGSCVRARWSHVLDDAGELQTAFALEAVARRGRLHHRPDPGDRAGDQLAPGRRPRDRAGDRRGRHASPSRPARAPSRRPARTRPAPPRRADAVAHGPAPGAGLPRPSGALFGAAEVTTVAFAEEQGQRWAGRRAARRVVVRQPRRRRGHRRRHLAPRPPALRLRWGRPRWRSRWCRCPSSTPCR